MGQWSDSPMARIFFDTMFPISHSAFLVTRAERNQSIWAPSSLELTVIAYHIWTIIAKPKEIEIVRIRVLGDTSHVVTNTLLSFRKL